MRAQWTQYHWRRFQAGQRRFTWRERLALTVIVLAAIPVLLLVFAGLFFFAVGLAAVVLAGWLVAVFLRPRRPEGARLTPTRCAPHPPSQLRLVVLVISHRRMRAP